MAKTGEICEVSGIYKCTLHPTHDVTMVKGKKYPPCDKAKAVPHSATWLFSVKTPH
jgi:hypothetical protein